MEGLARHIGVLALCIVAVLARREAAVASLDEPHTPADAGRIAGAHAGARAGHAAGAAAAKSAMEDADTSGVQPEYREPGFPNVLRVVADAANAIPASPEPVDQNPGAANFFRQFDANGDGAWTRDEWNSAVDRAIRLRYLPTTFDRDGEWAKAELTENGLLTLQAFLNWSAKTPAHLPPKKHVTIAPRYTIVKAYKFSNCEDAFGLYDANHDGVWDLTEFSKAVNGRVADDHIVSKWHTLPKKGPGTDKLDLQTWVDFCVALTGLPSGPAPRTRPKLACVPNPCKEAGTVCMEDPQVCLSGFDCPQFRCIKTNANIASPFARTYDNCTRTFAKFDLNKDNRLTEEEFRSGVHFGRGINFPGRRRLNVVKTWAHLHKDADNTVSLYEFVHFCVAVSEEGNDDGGVAKSECWDVFNQFDVDSSVDLSKAEFVRGMLRAKQHGHVPVDMKIKKVWKALPKRNRRVGPGPFIKWCLDVSRGINGEEAARSILAPAGIVPLPPPIASLISNTTVTNETLIIGWKNGTIVQSWMNGTVVVRYPDGTNQSYALPVYGVQPTSFKPLPVTPLISNEIKGVQLTAAQATTPTTPSTSTATLITPSVKITTPKAKSKSPLDFIAAQAKTALRTFANQLGLGAGAGAASLAHAAGGYQVSAVSPEYCVKLFRLGDTNKDGFLRVDEFQSICEDLFPADTCAKFPAIFFNADSNRNQRLEPAEFNPLCKSAPKFEAGQVTMVEAQKKAVSDASEAGKTAGAAAGEAAGRRAGERAAGLSALPFHNFRSVEPAPILTDEDVSHDLTAIDPADLD